LHHPQFSSCTFVVELPTAFENAQPHRCPSCSQPNAPKFHDRKSIHLHLDENGDVFVTPGVLETLKTVFLAGMEIVNEVEKPPMQKIGAVDRPQTLVVEKRLNQDQNGEQLYVPGETKYEARDRMAKALLDAGSVKEELNDG
jgi:hypothetical protein